MVSALPAEIKPTSDQSNSLVLYTMMDSEQNDEPHTTELDQSLQVLYTSAGAQAYHLLTNTTDDENKASDSNASNEYVECPRMSLASEHSDEHIVNIDSNTGLDLIRDGLDHTYRGAKSNASDIHPINGRKLMLHRSSQKNQSWMSKHMVCNKDTPKQCTCTF